MALETGQDVSYEIALKLRDLEENQKLTKERLLLVGENLIESQDKNDSELTELKKTNQELKDEVRRLKSIVNSLSEEVAKSARKEELLILKRQYKMFEPLKYARLEDIEQIIDKKLSNKGDLKKSETLEEMKENKESFWSGKL